MIAITGATGQLGQLVIKELLRSAPAQSLVAAVRSPQKAADIAASGVQVRKADYTQPETLVPAFAGAEKLLLISSSEIGQRVGQHRAVIEAARQAGVKLIAYTSVLHADTSPLGLAAEHRESESMLKASGIPFVVLRNGWYTENYGVFIPSALAQGVLMGSAGDGRISSAARADYAAAAARVLTSDGHAGRVYELAGDSSYSMVEFASQVARQAGTPVVYKNMSKDEYESALIGFGLPESVSGLLADCDQGVSAGALLDDNRQLSRLIGRATTPMADTVAAALAEQ